MTSQPQQHRLDDAITPAADQIGGSSGTEQNSIHGANDADAEGFQRPREQRRHDQRQVRRAARKSMYGSAENNALKAGKKTRELFVFNLDPEMTQDDLSSYLNNAGIDLIEIERRSIDDAMNKSFRITINNCDIDTVMKPEMWPCGVGVRPFYRKRASRDRKSNGPE